MLLLRVAEKAERRPEVIGVMLKDATQPRHVISPSKQETPLLGLQNVMPAAVKRHYHYQRCSVSLLGIVENVKNSSQTK